MATGISVKLPLVYSSEDGPYQLTKTLPETIKQNFKNYKNFSYLYTSHPSYYANNEVLFKLLSWLHKVLPAVLISEIFIFLQKSKN